MSTKEPNEKRIREKILQALKQKRNGSTAVLRQFEINKLVGKTSVRAPYLKALLEKMQEEELIGCHVIETPSTEYKCGLYWAVFNHPSNVKYRERLVLAKKEVEELHARLAEKARRKAIEDAPRLAKEKFQRDFDRFFAHNYNEIFDVIRRICRNYTPKTQWLHSRQL